VSQQRYNQSRVIDEQSTLVANQVNPVSNLIARGLDPLQRIDSLSISFVGTCTNGVGATTMTFSDIDDRDNFLDALVSNIRLYSSVYGEVIRSLSLSELAQAVSFVSGDFINTGLPKPGETKNFASGGTFRCQLVVPFRMNQANILSSFSPRVAGFADGGYQSTFGTGTFTDTGGGGTAWTIATCRTEVRAIGPIAPGEAKVSPACYESFRTSGVADLPSGAYLSLQQYSDSPATAYGTTGGASGGMRIMIDGVTTHNMEDVDFIQRTGDLVAQSKDPAAFELDCASDGGTANPTWLWGRPGLPVFFVDYTASSYQWPVAQRRISIEQGANLTNTNTQWLAVRVKALNEIGNAPLCGAAVAPSAIPAGLPGKSIASPTIRPYLGKKA